MTETQLVESNQSMSMLRRDLLVSHSIVIQIQITKTVMMKMMTDTTTKREATIIEEAQTTEEVLVVEVVNHFTKTTRFVKQITTEKSVIIVITKGMTTTPATITRTTFILTDTNASRNTALMMSRLATLKTTLSTKEDILELKMT